ncbi:asparagine synthase (glutamine-hydrolyzing) [Phytomonospora endophytica]|uniref:asparagine synthase (glutamine-hydrolyzing) n=1 Tax=Phytomonospora endophytica TaxID=714109 RepID=A0A841FJ56_9ACTN|nr:asparagine synthase (glutamine-hydrolyzing) [Phytomonospora endophytica]MBB6033868.1 asparagine synthase (glutamine-hydrolyzing) [Phytomonospora endophytica]GIG64613.1 putative asparagine synthetase AsnB [Phytomonospora endophytica]
MCGLLTFISAHGTASLFKGPIGDAVEHLHHRGPDETGVELIDDDAVLSHKRLSIIDVASSHQPMWYADGRYVMTFNGEIYNYKELRAELIANHGATFATDGDGEVILAGYHHWGPSVTTRLRGMFAFVIWDRRDRRAFGARDPFGIKPMFYLQTNDGVFFASEKKALMPFVDSRDIDEVNLSHYLTLQYPPEPGTMHRAVKRIGSGYQVVFDPGAPNERAAAVTSARYYRADFQPRPVDDPKRLYDEILDVLRESVRIHMRSDVPVGAFLSSGIDSTGVVALAREFNPEILTFTMGFDVPGHYNELDVAQESARAMGVTSIGTKIGAREMMEELPRIVWHLDDPVADPALVPLYFVAKKAAEYVTVAIGGEGADEFFAGYPIYREPLSLKGVQSLPQSMQSGLRAVSKVIPEGVKGKSFLERGTTPLEERFVGNANIFGEAEKQLLMRRYNPEVRYTDVTGPVYAECMGLDPTTRMQYVDIYTWLRGDILVKADRMSMAHSLEVRVPFLDPEVFKVAAKVPLDQKVPSRIAGQTKHALRMALESVVPPAIVNREKMGFPTPTRVWLKDEMFEWADHILATSNAGEYLDLNYARKLLRDHKAGVADNSRKVWTVLVFCTWFAIFVEKSLDPGIRRANSQLAHKPAVGSVVA